MNLKIFDRFSVRNVNFFNNFSCTLRYDAVASDFSFSFYFDPNNPDHKELACASHFHEAIVEHNGKRLITGYILSQGFNANPETTMVSFSGYSKTGVLEDSTIPIEAYPLESSDMSLLEVAQKYTQLFGLEISVDPAVSALINKRYDKITAEETQSVKDFLSGLAQKRDIVLSHDAFGRLLFTKAKTSQRPFLRCDGTAPVTGMRSKFEGQSIHSHITAIRQADKDGGNAGQFTIRNPYCPVRGIFRPTTITQDSDDANSTEDFAKRALANEVRQAVKIEVDLNTWEIDEKLVVPNTVITVVSPRLYLYNPVNLFVEQVAFSGDQTSEKSTLTCVPLEAYNGKYPVNIFTDPHL